MGWVRPTARHVAHGLSDLPTTPEGLLVVGWSDPQDRQTETGTISLQRSTGQHDGLRQQCLSYSFPTSAP